jgi:hypothetical protein
MILKSTHNKRIEQYIVNFRVSRRETVKILITPVSGDGNMHPGSVTCTYLYNIVSFGWQDSLWSVIGGVL